MAKLIISIFCLFLAACSAQRFCYEPGQCLNSNSFLLDTVSAVDYNNCLDKCVAFAGCNWFSFHGTASRICDLFSGCNEIFNGCSQNGCFTGEVTCNHKACQAGGLHGLCTGPQLEESPINAMSYDQCANMCFGLIMCNGYSYCDGQCFLYKEPCTDLDTDFPNCRSGDYDCENAGMCRKWGP